ncbi:hypothetical protein HK100_012822 [Physocladia obscura]|uniref:Uncharacterized protein n=1 Tax=Physocladia obscura TaxID=109957 RepID=A0AAD5XCX5_9FUNG|nr:hypothetical protein HK100_012822 [Physocladia obscura]
MFQFSYDPSATRMLQFFMCETSPSTYATTPLADYRDPANPKSGPFLPQNKGHSPAIFTMQIPSNASACSTFAIFYRYYFPSNESLYNQYTLIYLTIDKNTSNWISSSLEPVPTSALSTNANYTDSGNTRNTLIQTAWILGIISLIIFALLLTLTRRYGKKRGLKQNYLNPVNCIGTCRNRDSLLGDSNFLVSKGESSTANFDDFAVNDGYNSDDEIFVFKGGFSMTQALSAASREKSLSYDASAYRSILKKKLAADFESVDVYDAGSTEKYQNYEASSSNLIWKPVKSPVAQKRVRFKHFVESALIDESKTTLPDNSFPESLFVDRVEEMLQKSEVLNENESDEYNSELDDNDDWRNE